MNWILVFIAGLFETAFAFCLAKARETTGNERIFWYLAFLVALTLSMVLLVKAARTLPIGTAYAVWTGIGGCRNGDTWNCFFPGANHLLAYLFPDNPHRFHYWAEGGGGIKPAKICELQMNLRNG